MWDLDIVGILIVRWAVYFYFITLKHWSFKMSQNIKFARYKNDFILNVWLDAVIFFF